MVRVLVLVSGKILPRIVFKKDAITIYRNKKSLIHNKILINYLEITSGLIQ